MKQHPSRSDEMGEQVRSRCTRMYYKRIWDRPVELVNILERTAVPQQARPRPTRSFVKHFVAGASLWRWPRVQKAEAALLRRMCALATFIGLSEVYCRAKHSESHEITQYGYGGLYHVHCGRCGCQFSVTR